MNYHDIMTNNMDNGDGLRVILWLSGCNHHCKGCHNPQTWDPNGGKLFDDEALHKIEMELNKEYISGITFTGGDPLYPDNREEVFNLILYLKEKYPNKTIWLYTGYTWDYIISHILIPKDIFLNIDVLVEGKFIEEYRDTSLMWRGSYNQLVIDCKKTVKNNYFPISHIPFENAIAKKYRSKEEMERVIKYIA